MPLIIVKINMNNEIHLIENIFSTIIQEI